MATQDSPGRTGLLHKIETAEPPSKCLIKNAELASGLLGKLLNWMKTKNFALWLGANRSHSRSYGEDEQQRQGPEGAFSCSGNCDADH